MPPAADAPVVLDPEDPEVARHFADAGVTGDNVALKRLLDGPIFQAAKKPQWG